MRWGVGSLFRATLLFALGALTTAAIALAATLGDSNEFRETAVSDGTPIYGIHPTGEGLPLVGAQGTVGAGDYASPLKSYHDSGAYLQDVDAVDGNAENYLATRLEQIRSNWARCVRRAREAAQSTNSCAKPDPAMVLDIDETALSNYSFLALTNFSNATGQLALAVASGNVPALQPTLDLYNFAKSKGVAVFFITGRPENIPFVRSQTEMELHNAGYQNWDGLILNPETGGPAIPYKSGERAKIEQQGYRIIVNAGDQESDLRGGHAERGFKLPNPFYFIE